MKCEHCGGNLSLEDLTCPYCGAVNSHAQQHVRDMKRYHGEFQNTQKDVYAATRKYAGVTVRAVIIAVLLILCVILTMIGSRSYSIRRAILRNRAEKNFAAYSAEMDGYLEQEDYLSFHAFVEANAIDGYDTPYEKYIPVMRASSQYTYLYEQIMGTYTKIQQEADEKTIQTNAGYLADQLNYFYESLDIEKYNYCDGADSPENRAALERMERNVQALLRTYCGLTQEDAEGLSELSEARRMVLLEERIHDAK